MNRTLGTEMTETTMTMTATQPMTTNEASIKLPFGLMLWVAGLVSVVFGSGWFLVINLGFGPASIAWEGLIGSSVTLAVTVAGLLMMKPWKTRPITSWMTFWLGATVLRLMATPALAFLLYSAVSLSLTPFMLSVAASYMAVLFSEAGVLALYLKRVT